MTEVTHKTNRTPKALWTLSRLMLKLSQNAFASLRIEQSYRVKISKLEQEKKQRLHELEEGKDAIVRDIRAFMKGNRPEIERTAKSVTLATGQVGWREMKPSVEIIDGYTEKGVIESLMKRGRWALRFKPELNKQTILQNYFDATGKHRPIKGIAIKTGEEFFISIAPRGKEKPETIIAPSE
jgi:phage host-nuclease inhibitor protein Gam